MLPKMAAIPMNATEGIDVVVPSYTAKEALVLKLFYLLFLQLQEQLP